MANAANDYTMAIWDEIQAAFPGRFRFTSGTRSASQNAGVGGDPNSYHLTGQAVDFVPVDGRFPANELSAIGRIVSRHGYEVIKHTGTALHYHIEPAPGFTGGGGTSTTLMFLLGGVLLILLID